MLVACKPVEGQFRVIGSLQPILAVLGNDVILPCHVEPQSNVVGLTVEWSKPDLRPDPNDPLSRVDYVYLYRDTLEVPDMQIPSYTRRTMLFRDSLLQGNISLKITNVTFADEGRYKCFIPKLNGIIKSSILHLVVVPRTSTTETPQQCDLPTPDPKEETDLTGGLSTRSRLIPVVLFSVLILGVFTVYLTHKHQKQELTCSSWT
ncbi:myelin-oligodendrocyte glycoprotein-like [Symphorus nematophorus]